MSEQKGIELDITLGSHLDLFWMGDMRDCLDRGVDILCRALDLCREHPEYCFFIETTIFLEYFLQRRPQEKAYVKELIDAGRIEVGAAYADRMEHPNEGESILRQHVHAVRWMRETFGVHPRSVCHADLPGLSPQLPQICARCGIDYYLRARGPCIVLGWEAPDGSRIIYSSIGYHYWAKSVKEIGDIIASLPPHSRSAVVRGGYGDLQMPDDGILKALEEYRQAYPQVAFRIASPSRVLEQYRGRKDLPTIRGEWPFGWGSAASLCVDECQLSNRLQHLLPATEGLLAVCRALGEEPAMPEAKAVWWQILGRFKGELEPPAIAPGKEMEEVWKAALFAQDHNYQGFSGIKSEFDKEVALRQAIGYAEAIRSAAMSKIGSRIQRERDGSGTPVAVLNSLAWQRDGLAKLPLSALPGASDQVTVVDAQGREVAAQVEGDTLSLRAQEVPPLGYSVFHVRNAAAKPVSDWLTVDDSAQSEVRLTTDHFELTLNRSAGSIGRMYDKKLGQELTGGDGERGFAEVVSYEDPGVDVRYNFTGKRTRDFQEQPFRVYEKCRGPLYATFAMVGTICDARLEKEVTVYRDLRRIDLAVSICWWGKKDEQVRLSLPFRPAGHQETWYGVPFHAMKWPEMLSGLDESIILQMAQHMSDTLSAEDTRHYREVIGWLDVSYDAWGVALATRWPSVWIDGPRIEPSLLRTQFSCGEDNLYSLNPGKHRWEFSICPHEGDWRESKAYRLGWEHNEPLQAAAVGEAAAAADLPGDALSFLQPSADNIVVTAVKQAYDDPKSLVVRFYESEGSPAEVKLRCFRPVAAATETNLLEQEEGSLRCEGSVVTVPTRPWEIKTVKVRLA